MPARFGRIRLTALFLCLLGPLFLGAVSGRYASLVLDARTGKILHQVSAERALYPASLTKMMTLYLVFESLRQGKLRLSQSLKVSRRATRQEPSRLGLRTRDRITVKQAIMALICKSANDGALVLAEAVGGSERAFVHRMNRKAKLLGLRRTQFHNASGLYHPQQVTTAKDMAHLGLCLMRHFPHQYPYFRQRHFVYKGKRYRNTNKLVGRVHGVDGLKTGYISKAGFNLVSSAKRGGDRLVGVVIGGKTASWRDAHMASLIEMGFSRYGKSRKVPLRLTQKKRSRKPLGWRSKRVPLVRTNISADFRQDARRYMMPAALPVRARRGTLKPVRFGLDL